MSVAAAVDSARFLPAFAGPPPSVLIAEDEKKQRWTLIEQLDALGIVPLTASGGYEAIRLAAVERPDLILLDGLLPELHGFEVARFIRQIDHGYRPHIVIMTAIYKNIRYQNEARLKYGIDEYLIKPLQAESLAALVQRVKERP
jgi:CheY-like chemotaxis protein